MKTILLALLALGAFGEETCGTSLEKAPALAKVFNDRGIAGTFVMVDGRTETVFVWNRERAERRFPPAATFRIANAIIALETGVVRGVDDIVPFNATQHRTYESAQPYFYGTFLNRSRKPHRQRALRKSMRAPNTRTFRMLARGIGTKRMRDGVVKLAYGNMRVGNSVDRFWRDGSLQISALEQVEFLGRVARGEIPVSHEILDKVRELTLLEKTARYELHSKSGALFTSKPQLGWWVGWIERKSGIFPFALNMDIDTAEADDRVAIGRECLKALGKL
ncbi:MAG TPA: penicillin-binding transpeptidase domain-containing protein [Chthoniobacterales bacterium]|nr:penicillin-binding transpeptidase domain-containing protein [Chthoniobacterales bacterium]